MSFPKVGEVNILESAIGARGEGKSVFQCARVWESIHDWGGGYVIGHSLGRRLPKKLPASLWGGAELPITYYPTIRDLDRGLRRHPERWHILAPPSGAEARALGLDEGDQDTADDLLKYSDDLALGLRKAAWWRKHRWALYMPRMVDYQGLECPPIAVIIDEGVAVQAAKKGAADQANGRHDWFTAFLISLRHNHIALWYAIQNPTLRSWKVIEQSTAIHAFHLSHQWALDSIRAAGATPEEVEKIATMPRFEHVTISPIRSETSTSTAPPDSLVEAAKATPPVPA